MARASGRRTTPPATASRARGTSWPHHRDWWKSDLLPRLRPGAAIGPGGFSASPVSTGVSVVITSRDSSETLIGADDAALWSVWARPASARLRAGHSHSD